MPLDPSYLFPDYGSTVLRSPSKALVMPPLGMSELTGPRFGEGDLRESDADLTVHGSGEAIGERIIVHGRVTDAAGKPVAHSLVEVWQANAAGRYVPPRRPAPGAAGPELRRHRSLPDRCRRALHVHHRQARALPVERTTTTPGARPTSTSHSSGGRSRSGS